VKAILCQRYGTPDDLVLADVPDPVAGPGEVVARVAAVGLNFFDTLIIAGRYQTKPPFPFSPGGEFAGVVERVGPGVTEFQPGDNVVMTMMEHNSNYVPWYGLCREILPKLGRQVEYRLARFDPDTGELDYAHLASLIDRRTKLVCCTGASNFLGTKTRLGCVRELASLSGYVQPDGRAGSYLLVDAAQLVPSTFVDVRELDADFMSFSFHKLLAPFGVGVLYGKKHLLESMRPCLYGGDMVAQGGVAEDHVEYNELPWKFAAGTPNILGTVVSAQALRLLIDLVLTPDEPRYFRQDRPLERRDIRAEISKAKDWSEPLRPASAHLLIVRRRIPGPLNFLDAVEIDFRHATPPGRCLQRRRSDR